MPDAAYLRPFIVEVEPSEPTRIADVDLYLPDNHLPHNVDRAPLVVLVHGGPMRTAPSVPPTRWPVYIGYAALLNSLGISVAMFDHGLLGEDDEAAPDDLRTAVGTARGADGVDADRVVLWFVSGGGVLSPPYLHRSPKWLRGLAFSYAVLDDEDPDWDPREALRPGSSLPLLFTRVGQENPGLVDGQQQFVDEATRLGLPLSIIDVPDAGHAFDNAEPTAEGQDAVRDAARWIHESLAHTGY